VGCARLIFLPGEFAMPILVAFIALIALVYGAVRAFYALQAAWGLAVAVAVAALVVLLLIAAVVYWWRRRKEVAPNIRDGDWTHEIKGSWGAVRLAAGKRLCEVRLGGEQGAYIFADLLGAEVQRHDAQWQVALTVKDARHQVWVLPMLGERQAKQWRRVFLLAVEQRL
jgi:membrane protein implicated in regulation of membrane protease activity